MEDFSPYFHPLHKEMNDAMEAAGGDASEDRPKLYIDGERVDPDATDGPLTGQVARLCSVNDKTFAPIAERLDVERLAMVELRGADISALEGCHRLTHLNITWATKLADLSVLSAFSRLEFLEITDAPKVESIAPLAALKRLRWLCYQGGVWNKNHADDLEHLSGLSRLEALVLLNLKIDVGGLRPLAALSGLQALFLSNQFETADYAYLAVHLPDTTCAQFDAYQQINLDVGPHDIMVTGKRKPFLNSRDARDQARLAKYVAAFDKLKAGFQAEIEHKSA